MKRIIKKLLIAFFLFIGTSNVLAATCGTNEVSLKHGGYFYYGNVTDGTMGVDKWAVRQFYIEGSAKYNAYCVEPELDAVWEGCRPIKKEITDDEDYEDVVKSLYYAYDSPGWGAKWKKLYSQNFCGGYDPDNGVECSSDEYYAYGHVVISYFYPGSNWSQGLSNKYRNAVRAVASAIEDEEVDDPPTSFKVYLIKVDVDSSGQGQPDVSTQDVVYWEKGTTTACATVIKRDALSNKLLKGAKFQLYTDSECSSNKKFGSEKTTNKNGTVKWDNLVSDTTYYVKETSAPSGYYNNNNGCKTIGKSATGCKKNTKKDYPKLYCAKVKKVDGTSPGELLNDAEFDAYKGSSYIGTGWTGDDVFHYQYDSHSSTATEDGYFIVDMLPSGSYKFKETDEDGTILTYVSNPDKEYQYYNSTGTTAEVTATEMNFNDNKKYSCKTGTSGAVTATNYKYYACLKVKKVDKVTGDPLSGATFKYNGVSKTTGTSGVATWFLGAVDADTDISTQTYTVEETAAPDEYILPSPNTISAKAFLLTKNQNKNDAEAECLGTSKDSKANSYKFEDEKVLINWSKTDENNKKENDAHFKVYKGNKYVKAKANTFENWKDQNGVTKKCYVFDSLTTDSTQATSFKSMDTKTNGGTSNGEVCIVGFDTTESSSGSYTVEETIPLKYHTFGSTKTYSIPISKNYTDTYNFVNLPTKFILYKKVNGSSTLDQTTINQLKKLKFRIKKNGTALKFVLKNGIYELKDNTVDGPDGNGAEDLQLQTTHDSGTLKLEVHHLEEGGYTIEEVDIDGCTTSLGTTCKGNGFYKIPDSSFTISTDYNSVATVTMTNIRTELKFTKKDVYDYVKANDNDKVKYETTGEVSAFDGISFKLYIMVGGNKKYLNVSGGTNSGTCTLANSNSFGAFKEYRYVPESSGDGSTGTELHTYCGNIKITNLCRDETYYIEETNVPSGNVFVLPSPHPVVSYKIPNEGTVATNSANKVEISDTPTEVIINKKNNNPNEDIHEGSSRVETATFEVYKCSLSVDHCKKSNKIGSTIKFERISSVGGVQSYKALLDQNSTRTDIETSLKLTTVGSKGQIVLKYLPDNYKYVIVETNGPDGYYNVEGTLAELEIGAISKTGSTGTKDKVNYPTKIKFTKDDFREYYNAEDLDKVGSNTKIFDSMTFKLHDKDGNIVSLYKVRDGEYRFINAAGEHSGTVTELHTKNGNMLITHLYRNQTYYLEETAADTEGNFILPNNRDNSSLNLPSSMRNNKHPIVKYSIGNMVPNSSNPDSIPDSLTQLIDNDSTRVVFEKRDKKTGELIDDAKNDIYVEDDDYKNVLTTFNIYRCEKTVSHCTTSNGTLMHFEDRTYIKDKNGVDITSDITSITSPVLAYKYKKLNANGVTDLHTDRGVLVVAYLPSKYKYVLHEKVAPNGYYNPTDNTEDIEFTVKDSSLTSGETYETLTTRVENTPTEIHFTKKDLYNYYTKDDLSKINSDIKIFDSMKFVLRNKEGKIMKLKCSSNYEATGEHNEDRCRTGEYRYIPIDEDNTIENMHTLDGKITITHLYRNEVYYIEEVSEDTEGDFILPDYLTYSEGLPFDHKGHPVVKYIVPPNAPTDQASVTQIISNIPSRVIFQKRDSKYNYLIPDETTTFNVYQCSLDVEKCTPEVGTMINFTERAVISGDQEDSGKEVYKYSKLNANGVTDLHPYRGELILRYLPTKYKYVLVETISPQGYMLPEGENAYTYFTISETKVDVEEIQVPNKPVSLLIRKYNQDGELLEDATFNISKAKNCNFNIAPNKIEREELLNLKTIRDGVYEARPTGDTKLFKTCKDRPDYMCNQINRTLTYPDYDTEVFGNSMGDFEALVNSRNERINIEAGEALIQYLDYGGCYVIEEVQAPKGYSLPENEEDRFVMIKITDKEQVFDTYEQLVNTPTPFSFYKQDEYGKPLDGAKYKLQKLNDKKIYEDVAVSKDDTFEDAMVYKIDPNSTNYIMETKDGKATITYLEEGQYRVLEIEAPEGYELPKKTMNVATFFVDKDGKVFGSSIIANKPKTSVNKKFDASAKATFVVNIDTGQKIIKYGLVIGLLIIIIISLILINKKRKENE